MYILQCANDAYYTGSTKNLDLRLAQHQNGEGANFTRKHLPVKLVYYEEFQRIDEAFFREKQVQGWSRKKKEALINGEFGKLPELSRNYTQNANTILRQAQDTQLFVEPVETNPAEMKSTETTTPSVIEPVEMKSTETKSE